MNAEDQVWVAHKDGQVTEKGAADRAHRTEQQMTQTIRGKHKRIREEDRAHHMRDHVV